MLSRRAYHKYSKTRVRDRQGGKMLIVWLIPNTLILLILARVAFGFLLLSNHQTLQEAGGGGGQISRVR
jgi:hypothetical protein